MSLIKQQRCQLNSICTAPPFTLFKKISIQSGTKLGRSRRGNRSDGKSERTNLFADFGKPSLSNQILPPSLRYVRTQVVLKEDVGKSVMIKFHAAKAKFDQITQLKENLLLENNKLRHSVEQEKTKITSFRPELREMDERSLKEELQALLSDRAEETEYVQSLQLQIMQLKEISHTVKCSCGKVYNVKMDECA